MQCEWNAFSAVCLCICKWYASWLKYQDLFFRYKNQGIIRLYNLCIYYKVLNKDNMPLTKFKAISNKPFHEFLFIQLMLNGKKCLYI